MKTTTLLFLLLAGSTLQATPDLEIFDGNYPISFFFRQTEGTAANGNMSYERWNSGFSRLHGVMGKMLNEEVLGRSAAQEYYRRFKQEHPRQAVLLHANGGFRKPLADIREYHDGHWLYYNGTKVLDSIPKEQKTVTIRVNDVGLFQLHPYRTNPALPDDVGLCALHDDGTPNWNYAEQARLTGIDESNKTITLERSVYGDKVRHAYKAGKAYVAAHVAQNWGRTNKLWEFNMATTCPKDADGRQAADIWAGELIQAIRPGGEIDYIDGVQFDVPFVIPISLGRNRKPDADADGRPDYGVVDGTPVFAHGVERFFRILREALPDKLIMADSGGKSQRCLKYLNGMEIEGFPELKDTEFNHWSTATNYLRFWSKRSREPRLTYGLMKYLRWPRKPKMSDSRLILAGTTLYDAAVPLGRIPDRDPDFLFDELVGGELNRKGWLGKPVAPARRLALESTNIASDKWYSNTARISKSADRIEIRSGNDKEYLTRFALEDIRHEENGDLLLALTVSAQGRKNYPEPGYREMAVELKGSAKIPAAIQQTHFASPVGEQPFQAVFYFRDVPAGELQFSLGIEGNEPVWIHDCAVHEAPDIAVREFEHGVILANPSNQAHDVQLARLFPGQSFRRLLATRDQDLRTNNGKKTGRVLRLNARDALFLMKE